MTTITGIDLKKQGRLLRGQCPDHVDNTPSFTVFEDGHYHCFSCGKHGWVSDLTGEKPMYRKTKDGYRQKEEKIWPSLNWSDYSLYQDMDVKRLARWRGYNEGFVDQMFGRNWIGLFEDQFCFPIHQGTRVVRLHVRQDERLEQGCRRDWFYHPAIGSSATPLVLALGNKSTHIFESQWDMFALMSQMGIGKFSHTFISTRGAGNAGKLGTIHVTENVYAWPQNDPAGKRWLEGVQAYVKNVKIISVPTDANDYLKQGGNLFSLV